MPTMKFIFNFSIPQSGSSRLKAIGKGRGGERRPSALWAIVPLCFFSASVLAAGFSMPTEANYNEFVAEKRVALPATAATGPSKEALQPYSALPKSLPQVGEAYTMKPAVPEKAALTPFPLEETLAEEAREKRPVKTLDRQAVQEIIKSQMPEEGKALWTEEDEANLAALKKLPPYEASEAAKDRRPKSSADMTDAGKNRLASTLPKKEARETDHWIEIKAVGKDAATAKINAGVVALRRVLHEKAGRDFLLKHGETVRQVFILKSEDFVKGIHLFEEERLPKRIEVKARVLIDEAKVDQALRKMQSGSR